MKVLLGSGNARKLGEARLGCAPYGISVELVAVAFREMQSTDPVAIAVDKSRQAFAQVGRPVLVADTFWAIPALNGFPGAYMKEVTRWFGPQDFLNLLAPYANRRILLTETVVFVAADGETQVFCGEYWGEITPEPRGDGLPVEQVVAFGGETIAERRNRGLFSHDPEEFIWAEFARWYARAHKQGGSCGDDALR